MKRLIPVLSILILAMLMIFTACDNGSDNAVVTTAEVTEAVTEAPTEAPAEETKAPASKETTAAATTATAVETTAPETTVAVGDAYKDIYAAHGTAPVDPEVAFQLFGEKASSDNVTTNMKFTGKANMTMSMVVEGVNADMSVPVDFEIILTQDGKMSFSLTSNMLGNINIAYVDGWAYITATDPSSDTATSTKVMVGEEEFAQLADAIVEILEEFGPFGSAEPEDTPNDENIALYNYTVTVTPEPVVPEVSVTPDEELMGFESMLDNLKLADIIEKTYFTYSQKAAGSLELNIVYGGEKLNKFLAEFGKMMDAAAPEASAELGMTFTEFFAAIQLPADGNYFTIAMDDKGGFLAMDLGMKMDFAADNEIFAQANLAGSSIAMQFSIGATYSDDITVTLPEGADEFVETPFEVIMENLFGGMSGSGSEFETEIFDGKLFHGTYVAETDMFVSVLSFEEGTDILYSQIISNDEVVAEGTLKYEVKDNTIMIYETVDVENGNVDTDPIEFTVTDNSIIIGGVEYVRIA